jgi:hypothetical protein
VAYEEHKAADATYVDPQDQVKGNEVSNGCIECVCVLHCNWMVGKNLLPNALQSGTQGTREVEEQGQALMSSILHGVHHLVDKGLAMREHELQVSMTELFYLKLIRCVRKCTT